MNQNYHVDFLNLAKAVVIRAEGEASAASLISKALATHGPGLIELRRIDVSAHY